MELDEAPLKKVGGNIEGVINDPTSERTSESLVPWEGGISA